MREAVTRTIHLSMILRCCSIMSYVHLLTRCSHCIGILVYILKICGSTPIDCLNYAPLSTLALSSRPDDQIDQSMVGWGVTSLDINAFRDTLELEA